MEKNIDWEKYHQSVDAFKVVQHMKMYYQERNGRIHIYCPGHEIRMGKKDNHLGNCILYKSGYRCYSCGVFVPVHEMIMEYQSCSFEEAYQIIETVMGQEFHQDSVTAGGLNKEELLVLQLAPNFYQVVQTRCAAAGEGANIQVGLGILQRDNPGRYYQLVLDRAIEMKGLYKRLQQCCQGPEAPGAYDVYLLLGADKFDGRVYRDLSKTLNHRIKICKKLINIFSAYKERA